MSDKPAGTPARLLFTPLHADTADTEADSGHLADLYYCDSTARFFSLLTADIVSERRSSRSAKQFFCPVCPDSLIKLSKLRCPTCKWQASSIGITDISTLLQRDGDPYPWISAEIRQLHARFFAHNDNQELTAEDISADITSIGERRSSLQEIQPTKPDSDSPKEDLASTPAQRFAKRQIEKERLIFSQWMPGMEMVEWNHLQGRPDGDISAFLAEDNVDKFIEVEQRVCSTTWLKCQLPARRRLPQPKVRIGSPYASGETREADKIAPEVRTWMRDGCRGDAQSAVDVVVSNEQKLGELFLAVANSDNKDEYAEAMISQGSRATLTISPFSFREEPIPEVLDEFSMCNSLAALDVSFRYSERDSEATPEQESQLRIYARHLR